MGFGYYFQVCFVLFDLLCLDVGLGIGLLCLTCLLCLGGLFDCLFDI